MGIAAVHTYTYRHMPRHFHYTSQPTFSLCLCLATNWFLFCLRNRQERVRVCVVRARAHRSVSCLFLSRPASQPAGGFHSIIVLGEGLPRGVFLIIVIFRRDGISSSSFSYFSSMDYLCKNSWPRKAYGARKYFLIPTEEDKQNQQNKRISSCLTEQVTRWWCVCYVCML